VKDYLPDFHPYSNSLIARFDRDFFWNVVYTLHPEEVKKMVEHPRDRRPLAHDPRLTLRDENEQVLIQVNPVIFEMLLKSTYVSDHEGFAKVKNWVKRRD
jgi:hypothetical protein